MAKKTKTGKPKKTDDPEYVTNVMKQMYENQIKAISRKIERRRQWAAEWAEEIPEMEESMKAIQQKEDENIKELTTQLDEKKTLKLEMRESVKRLSKQIEDDLLYYKQKIEEIEQHRCETEQINFAEIAALEESVTAVREFKQNKVQLEIELASRERKMDILQEKHEEKLAKLKDKREHQEENLKKEAEKQLLKFSDQFRKGNVGVGEVFEKNSNLRDELAYLREKISKFKYEIPETEKNVKSIQKRIKEKQRDEFLMIEKVTSMAQVLEETNFENLSILTCSSESTSTETSPGDNDNETERRTYSDTSKSDDIVKTKEIKTRNIKTSEIKTRDLKTCSLQVTAVLKAARKILHEIQALTVIPEGELIEEQNLSDEERSKRFRARRNACFKRRGELLRYTLQILAHA